MEKHNQNKIISDVMSQTLKSVDIAYQNNKAKIEEAFFDIALEGIAKGRMSFEKDPILPYVLDTINQTVEKFNKISPEDQNKLVSLTEDQQAQIRASDARVRDEFLNNQPKIDGSLRNNQIVGKILSRWGQNWLDSFIKFIDMLGRDLKWEKNEENYKEFDGLKEFGVAFAIFRLKRVENVSILIFFVFRKIFFDGEFPFDTDKIIMKRGLKQFSWAIIIGLIIWKRLLFFEFLMFGIDSFGLDLDGNSVDSKVFFTFLETHGKVWRFIRRIFDSRRTMLEESEVIVLLGGVRIRDGRVATGDIEKAFAGFFIEEFGFGGLFLVDLFESSEADFLDGVEGFEMIVWGDVNHGEFSYNYF
jgi:hypothetical protein